MTLELEETEQDPPTSAQHCFLPPSASRGHQLECQEVDRKDRQAGGQLQDRPGRRLAAGGTDDTLCEAAGNRWGTRMALQRPFGYKGSSISKGREGRSSQMQSLGLTATMESPGGPRAGISGSPRRDHLPLQLAGSSMRDGSS